MKKKKEKFEDDGRTIADMNVEGFKWYNPEVKTDGKHCEKKQPIPKSEKRAVFLSGWRAFAFPVICALLGGLIAFALLYFVWLN